MPQKHAMKNVLNTVPQQLKSTMYPGADPGSFLGGGAPVSCSASTPIIHIVFFCRIPVLENRRSCQGAGGAHPLHPPPRSAPDISAISDQ